MENSVITIGTEIMYHTYSGPSTRAKVTNIQICKVGEKWGREVSKCDYKRHRNGTVCLSDDHWCYFDQIERVI